MKSDNAKIKPIALVAIELPALISKWASKSVSQSVENLTKFLKSAELFLGLIWRHFWDQLYLTNTDKQSKGKILAGFWVIMTLWKPQTFMIPIYSTTILYDTHLKFNMKRVYIHLTLISPCQSLYILKNKDDHTTWISLISHLSLLTSINEDGTVSGTTQMDLQ